MAVGDGVLPGVLPQTGTESVWKVLSRYKEATPPFLGSLASRLTIPSHFHSHSPPDGLSVSKTITKPLVFVR